MPDVLLEGSGHVIISSHLLHSEGHLFWRSSGLRPSTEIEGSKECYLGGNRAAYYICICLMCAIILQRQPSVQELHNECNENLKREGRYVLLLWHRRSHCLSIVQVCSRVLHQCFGRESGGKGARS